jgi:hypothetical protein
MPLQECGCLANVAMHIHKLEEQGVAAHDNC